MRALEQIDLTGRDGGEDSDARIRNLEATLARELSIAERLRALESIVGMLVTVSRHREAVERAGQLEALMGLKRPTRRTIWLCTELLRRVRSARDKPSTLRAIRRLVPISDEHPNASFGAARAVQFAYFWHNIHDCTGLSLVQLAAAQGPMETRKARAWLGYAHAYGGNGAAGIPILRDALADMHRARDRENLCQTYPLLAIAYQMNGQVARGRHYHELFLARYAGDDPFYKLLALTNLHGVAFAQGNFLALRKYIDLCFAECFALDRSRHHLQVQGWYAVLLTVEGRHREAREALERARQSAQRIDNNLDYVIFARLGALTCLLMGEYAEAEVFVREGKRRNRAYGNARFYARELSDLSSLAAHLAGTGAASKRLLAQKADLFAACVAYTRARSLSFSERSAETTLHDLGGRLNDALSGSFGFDMELGADRDALERSLKSLFSTDYVVMARDLASLRQRAEQDLGSYVLSIAPEGTKELRLVCPGGGLFVGYECPHTVEMDDGLAVGVRLSDLDVVSESLIKAHLRMVLAHYVAVRSIRVSREKYATEKRTAALGRLTRMFAHDVRQPFAVLKVAITALSHTETPAEFRELASEFLLDMERSVSTVDDLVQDVLEIDSYAEPKCDAEAPSSLIEAALNQVFQANLEARVALEYDLAHTRTAFIDGLKMLRVFCNIVTNAVQAMEGRGTIWFRSRDLTRNGKHYVQFCIGNDGPRIRRTDVALIFDPLYTADKPGGTGLGLAIAHKIVGAHGGRIECEADAPRGVEFWFEVPAGPPESRSEKHELPRDSQQFTRRIQALRQRRQDEPENQSSAELLQQVFRSARALGRRISIFIVDDEPVYRRWLLDLVERVEGLAEVAVAAAVGSTEQCMNHEGWPDADLFIVDVDLKEREDGLTLVRRLRECKSRALVAVHSNHVLPEDFRSAAAAGADACLPKPMSKAHLLRLVQQAAELALPPRAAVATDA